MLSAQTKFEAFTMDELDFSGKQVLVVGGSSGIGNGIAHAFLERGAATHVWGTRPTASDYDGVEGYASTFAPEEQLDAMMERLRNIFISLGGNTNQ